MLIRFSRSAFTGHRRSLMAAFFLSSLAIASVAPSNETFARMGSGFSFGNRGTRTFSVPPSTATAPRTSAIPGGSANPASGFNQYGYGQRPGGFFSGGFGRGLLGGLLGAGLFGMLFGNGFGGGLGGGASVFGLLLQLGLLYLLFRFVMGFFRDRAPSFGAAGAGVAYRNGGGFGVAGGAPAAIPITLDPSDYAVFEHRLIAMQAAFSAEDVGTLRSLAVPDMVTHFTGELATNGRQGLVNRLSDVKLLQGDLSEAWREGSTDYATVAMRFSLIDTMIERASGRIVRGHGVTPQVVTELWTFTRRSGSGANGWLLSAIQQV